MSNLRSSYSQVAKIDSNEIEKYYFTKKDDKVELANSDIYDLANYAKYFNYPFIHDFTASVFIRELREIPYSSIYRNSNQALDQISYDIYGTEKLWWVLGLYNNIIDPIITEVDLMYIPDAKSLELLIQRYFDKLKNQQ